MYIKNGEISFSYQKKKYVWDDDKKVFNKLRYPIDMNSSISIFQNSKGLETVNEIKSAQEKYGFNRFDCFLLQITCLYYVLIMVFLIYLGSTFQYQHFENCSRSMLLLLSSFSNYFVLVSGLWMSIGITHYLHYLCWSCLNRLSFFRYISNYGMNFLFANH
jgi:hypothetical protein